jgi:hypothetical protein
VPAPKYRRLSSTETPDDLTSYSDSGRYDDDRLSLPTPKPLTRNGSHQDGGGYPFSISQTVRQLDTNELAAQLRSDKLIDAAGGTAPPKPVGLTVAPEGDSLTEENVGKLERAESRGRR